MPANREQIEQLISAAPDFRNRWEGFLKDREGEEVPPWFVGMSELAHYVVERLRVKSLTLFLMKENWE